MHEEQLKTIFAVIFLMRSLGEYNEQVLNDGELDRQQKNNILVNRENKYQRLRNLYYQIVSIPQQAEKYHPPNPFPPGRQNYYDLYRAIEGGLINMPYDEFIAPKNKQKPKPTQLLARELFPVFDQLFKDRKYEKDADLPLMRIGITAFDRMIGRTTREGDTDNVSGIGEAKSRFDMIYNQAFAQTQMTLPNKIDDETSAFFSTAFEQIIRVEGINLSEPYVRLTNEAVDRTIPQMINLEGQYREGTPPAMKR